MGNIAMVNNWGQICVKLFNLSNMHGNSNLLLKSVAKKFGKKIFCDAFGF